MQKSTSRIMDGTVKCPDCQAKIRIDRFIQSPTDNTSCKMVDTAEKSRLKFGYGWSLPQQWLVSKVHRAEVYNYHQRKKETAAGEDDRSRLDESAPLLLTTVDSFDWFSIFSLKLTG